MGERTNTKGRPKLSLPTVRVTMSWRTPLLNCLDEMCRITGKSRQAMIHGLVESYYKEFKEAMDEHPDVVPIVMHRSGRKRDN